MSPLESRDPGAPRGSLDTMVAGMTCRDVLYRLNGFLDGDLAPEDVARVTAHLAECHACEQFGGRVAALIEALRQGRTGATEDMPPAAAARLRARLAAERR